MNKIQFSLPWAGVAAFVLWLVSIFIPITLSVAVLFLAITGAAGMYGGTAYDGSGSGIIRAEGYVQGGGKGNGWKLNWEWKDWGGLILLILVVAALAKGANPIDLIKVIGPIFGGNK